MRPIIRKNSLPPVHPGEILREDVLPETGPSVSAAAKALGVSRQMLHDIVAERKPRSDVFKAFEVIWNLAGDVDPAAGYDLKKAAQDKKVMERVARIVPIQQPG